MEHSPFLLNGETLSAIEDLGEHMPGGFFIYKAEQPEELIYANRPVLDIYGCESLEAFKAHTGFTFRGMVHPEDYERISASIIEQIQSNDDHMDYAEYRIIRKDGAVRWVDDYGHYADTEAYGGVYTVFISDITEKHERIANDLAGQRATIEKIHAERLTFSRVAQALARDYFSIYVVDPETCHFTEYSSTEDYRLLGVEKEGDDFFNVSRKNMDRLIYPEDKERFMSVFTRERIMSILKRDGNFTTKYRLMVDGVPTYVSMKATLLEDENGSQLVFGTNKIDAQMKREEEYQSRVAAARNKAKNDFLANMSHDIRTPMNAIVGYTNIANRHLDQPDIVKDSLEKISSSSHFLLSLINDVLDMSKIESGKMQLSMGPCSLSDIFRRIEDITLLQAQKKSLKITYSKDRIRHFSVLGDELRIEQILINIVSNAIKYTPEGKTVSLTAEETEGVRPGTGHYRFIIADTGIGISEDYLPHIFDSFTREQSTTINKIQGTGLGLAITARVVEKMGGKLSVQSRLGEGSTFTVDLELEILEEETDREKKSAEHAPVILSGRRVLLVEDNDINAEIAMMILSQSGLEIDWAQDGQKGLEQLRAKGDGFYDAVLMDIQMPVMNGYEATRALRAIGGTYCSTLPVIAMSANAYDEDVQQCLEAGMNTHIAKPFNPDELLMVLKSAMESGTRAEQAHYTQGG